MALWDVGDGQLVECQQPQVIEVDLLLYMCPPSISLVLIASCSRFKSLQGNSPIWSLCDTECGSLVTGGESGAVVRTAFGKKESEEVDTSLVEAR